jgi:hypothetical protein
VFRWVSGCFGVSIGETGSSGNVSVFASGQEATGTNDSLLGIEILESTNGQIITGSNGVKVNPMKYFGEIMTNGDYLSKPFAVPINSVAPSGMGIMSTDDDRYQRNLDLGIGEVYLRKAALECIEEKHANLSNLLGQDGNGNIYVANPTGFGLDHWLLYYNTSTGTATLNLNGRSKDYSVSLGNATNINNRLVVNYEELINHFYAYVKSGDWQYDMSIQRLINGKYRDGSGGLSLAWERNPSERTYIANMANNLRQFFNANSISMLYYINNENGANIAGGMGHNAILLRTTSGNGILFSFFPGPGNFLGGLGGPGEMRVKWLSNSEFQSFLSPSEYPVGVIPKCITNFGDIRHNEVYTRYISRNIETTSGKKVFDEGVNYFMNAGFYTIFGRQCDNIASQVAAAGGYGWTISGIPNSDFFDIAAALNGGYGNPNYEDIIVRIEITDYH